MNISKGLAIPRFCQALCLVMAFLGCGLVAHSQETPFSEMDFRQAKGSLRKGHYDRAIDQFMPLTVENDRNPFSAYAKYFTALAHLKKNELRQANSLLLDLLKKEPNWENIAEAYYLLGVINLERKKYDIALRYLNQTENKGELSQDAHDAKAHYFAKIKKLDSLKSLRQRFPDDKALAEVLADRLFLEMDSEKERDLFNMIIDKFELEKFHETSRKAEKEKFKQRYRFNADSTFNFAVMLPYQMEAFENSDRKRPKNGFVYDFQMGLRLAQQHLEDSGFTIQLHHYDTKKDEKAVRGILKKPGLKQMNAFIGPLYTNLSDVVARYANIYRIPVINPLSTNTSLLKYNNTYLAQPIPKTLGQRSAKVLLNNAEERPQKAVLLYGKDPKDSTQAYAFYEALKKASEKGEVELLMEFPVTEKRAKYVSEKMKRLKGLDSTTVVYVASENDLVPVQVMSALEFKSIKASVVAPESWLNNRIIRLDQYQQIGVFFAAPDFMNPNQEKVKAFRKAYQEQFKIIPSYYSQLGYNLLWFLVKAPINNRVALRELFLANKTTLGRLYGGFNFGAGDGDNHYVPLYRLSPQMEMQPVNESYWEQVKIERPKIKAQED